MKKLLSCNEIMKKMLYLIGFMGVGKTTIGQRLAKQHSLNFIDTDKEIEKLTNKSITNIFEQYSESHFRNLETKTLNHLKGNVIVACGGGLPIYNNNMNIIKRSGISIYLKASEDEIFMRLSKSLKKRPLIADGSTKNVKKNIIKKTLSERERFYAMADYIIDTNNASETDVLRKINSLPIFI